MLLTLSGLASQQNHTLWISGLDATLINQGLEALVAEGIAGARITQKDLDPETENEPERSRLHALIDDLSHIDPELNPITAARWMMVREAREAADVLAGRFHASYGREGLCCVTMPADLIGDSRSIIDAVRALQLEIDRPNIMIEIPASSAGCEALTQLVAEGAHVNIGPVVTPAQLDDVLSAYEKGVARNLSPSDVVSTITVPVAELGERLDEALKKKGERFDGASGQGGVALADRLYRRARDFFDSHHFQQEEGRGAPPQRLVWELGEQDDVDTAELWRALVFENTVALVDLETLERIIQAPVAAPSRHPGVEHDWLDELKRKGVDWEVVSGEVEMEHFDRRTAELERTLQDIARLI